MITINLEQILLYGLAFIGAWVLLPRLVKVFVWIVTAIVFLIRGDG